MKNQSHFKLPTKCGLVTAFLLTASCATVDGIKSDIGGVVEKTKNTVSKKETDPVTTEEEAPLTEEEKILVAIQVHLTTLGYYAGAQDGVFSASTEAAIQDFQLDNSLRIDGKPTQAVLEAIEKKVESK